MISSSDPRPNPAPAEARRRSAGEPGSIGSSFSEVFSRKDGDRPRPDRGRAQAPNGAAQEPRGGAVRGSPRGNRILEARSKATPSFSGSTPPRSSRSTFADTGPGRTGTARPKTDAAAGRSEDRGVRRPRRDPRPAHSVPIGLRSILSEPGSRFSATWSPARRARGHGRRPESVS